jgi:hypothetical protein
MAGLAAMAGSARRHARGASGRGTPGRGGGYHRRCSSSAQCSGCPFFPLVKTVEDDLVAHILQCPMKARMDAVESYVTTTRAMAVYNRHWIDRVMPLIYAAAGISFYLVIVHGPEMLKFLQR